MKLVLFTFVQVLPVGFLLAAFFIPVARGFLVCGVIGIYYGYALGRIAHLERKLIAEEQQKASSH